MYDEVRCEHPLPQTGYRVPDRHVFQTKDLENALLRYTITADGRLVLHREVMEEVPEEERPYYGTPGWDGPLGRLVGSVRSEPAGDEEVRYHGDLRFHDAFRVVGEGASPGERVWIEYRARFTEGSLARIEVADVHGLPPTKTVEIPGGGEFRAAESGLGFDVVYLGGEAEVEALPKDPEPAAPEEGPATRRCRLCGRPVVKNRGDYEVFEGMHWICFHIAFEHVGADPDEPCEDPSCPWAVMRAYEEELRRLGRDPGEVLERSWGLGGGT
jgi:hypothetical protein